jgi:hypothetical protein
MSFEVTPHWQCVGVHGEAMYGRFEMVWQLGNKGWRKVGTACCAIIAMSSATPALADIGPLTAYYKEPDKGPPSVQFKLDVLASVGGRCGFASGSAPNGSIDAGEIDVALWNGQVAFMPNCTAQWRSAVSSQNGALKSDTPTGGALGFTDVAPYTVSLHVVHDTGFIDRNCPVDQIAASLTASACEFRGTASPSNGMLVPRSFSKPGSYIAAGAPAYTGTSKLVAGNYTDTLTVTISPAT